MILIVFVGLSAVAVPLARGRLMNLAQLRFRRPWLLFAAIACQGWLLLVTGPRTATRDVVYILSFLLAFSFLWENRRIPGLWLVGVGALMNLTAITVNGGVMPASPHALGAAGLPTGTSQTFINSMALPAPRLAFLGDIFAIPKSWPLSNVFSAGDICVALGSAVAIHRVSGSRLVPSGRGQFIPLLRRPRFMRLWSAQAVSNLGDWTYSLAVAATLVNRTHSPAALSFLLIAQVAPAVICGPFLSALPDRHSRVKLMIASDVVSAFAVGSLLVGSPSPVHIYAVAALLGVFGALFQPSLRASVPNVVREDQIVAANALVGSTYNFAIMAGPAIGGLLVAQLGVTPVFAINAASFLISASLIAGIRLPRIEAPAGPRPSAFRDVVEGARYSLSTPLVRGLLLVIGIVLVAAASKAPLESLFVMGTLSLGPEALGLVMGSWGIGMLIGSAAAPAICRQWPRERVLMVMIVVVAGCVLVAARAGDIETVLLAWLVAGAANSIANVAYESLLQERTPNEFRGRVFAAFGFVRNVAFLAGAFMAGWLGSHLGIRLSYVFSGGLFLVAAAVCKITLGERVRRGTLSRVVHFLAPRTRARASSYAGAVNGSADSDRQRVFALAQELGSVRAACRAVGIHPSTYYRWKTKFEHDRGRPGAVVEMDIFPVRRLPGKGGEVWQYTAIDLATGYCWAELHITRRDPSARLTSDLAERVAADLASRGWVLQRVLTGDGAEFRSDRFEQTVARLGADHEFMRGATAQDNGVVERLQRTIRDECWGPTLARFVPADYAGLRSVLEKYVAGHNARSSLAGHPPARPQESRPTSLMPALRRP